MTGAEAPVALPREAMTPRQLARRARLLEAVVEIVTEVGPHALQMREVAERSGVALGTAYKYFRSREQLLAAALAEWQQPLMGRMASAGRSADADTAVLVTTYLRRALRAFHRNPHMGALMVLMQTSADPDVVETLAEMGTRSTALMEQLLVGLPADTVPHVSRGLEAVLMNSVTALVTGRAGLDEAQDRVEGVARLLLAGAAGTPGDVMERPRCRVPRRAERGAGGTGVLHSSSVRYPRFGDSQRSASARVQPLRLA